MLPLPNFCILLFLRSLQGEKEGGETSAAVLRPPPMMKLERAEEREQQAETGGGGEGRSKQCLKSRQQLPSSEFIRSPSLPPFHERRRLPLSPSLLAAAPADAGTALRPHWSTHGRGWRRPTARGRANGRCDEGEGRRTSKWKK